MKTLIKWLQEHGIEFECEHHSLFNIEYVIIILEKDCVWINGFGEEMKYDKLLRIYKDNSYKKYYLGEVTGFNRGKTLYRGTRVKDLIKVLAKRLEVAE